MADFTPEQLARLQDMTQVGAVLIEEGISTIAHAQGGPGGDEDIAPLMIGNQVSADHVKPGAVGIMPVAWTTSRSFAAAAAELLDNGIVIDMSQSNVRNVHVEQVIDLTPPMKGGE